MNERLYKEWVGSKCGLPQEIGEKLPEKLEDGTHFCIRCPAGCSVPAACFLVRRERVFEGKSIEAIEARVLSVPGAWLIEERPKFEGQDQRYALYAGRYDTLEGQIFGGTHGLNLLGLYEPDYRWKNVRPMLENAHSDILWLLLELKKAEEKIVALEKERDEEWIASHSRG